MNIWMIRVCLAILALPLAAAAGVRAVSESVFQSIRHAVQRRAAAAP